MARWTRMQVKEAAREWAAIGIRIGKLQRAKVKELAAFADAHKPELEAINAKHDSKIQTLNEKQLVLEKQVLNWLGEIKKPITIDAGTAVAQNIEKEGNRVLDPQKFFEFVKERNAAFWGCVTIGIEKAKKLIGDAKVTELSTKPTTIKPSLTHKSDK